MKIYIIWHLPTGNPLYIGKSVDPQNRFRQHKHANRFPKWEFDVKPLFADPCELEVVEDVSNEEANFWEAYYIQLYLSWGFTLYNRERDSVKVFTDKTRENLRIKATGRKQSDETLVKRSEAMKRSHAERGGHSEKTKRKIGDANRGIVRTEEDKENIRQWNLENSPSRKRVMVDGQWYDGVRLASRETGINYNTIQWRLRNGVEGYRYA